MQDLIKKIENMELEKLTEKLESYGIEFVANKNNKKGGELNE